MTVLSDSSMAIGDRVVSGDEPYFLSKPGKNAEPAGTMPAGSFVRLLSRGRGKYCLVADGSERQVYLAFSALRPLDTPKTPRKTARKTTI
jgi:hypothetical protein